MMKNARLLSREGVFACFNVSINNIHIYLYAYRYMCIYLSCPLMFTTYRAALIKQARSHLAVSRWYPAVIRRLHACMTSFCCTLLAHTYVSIYNPCAHACAAWGLARCVCPRRVCKSAFSQPRRVRLPRPSLDPCVSPPQK